MTGEHYIVDEFTFSIKRDTIDFGNPLKFLDGYGLVPNHEKDEMVVYRGAKNTLNPFGKIYPGRNCFTKKEDADARLLEVCSNTLSKNLTVIKNLEAENEKLCNIIAKLHGK